MKTFQFKTTLIFIFLTSITFPQWSTDPNNNLIVGYGQDPKICSDSTGGCYVTYNYGTLSYPQKLALERLDKNGYKPWGTLKQILGELPEQWQAEIIEDGEGGVIVSYQDNEWIPPAYFNSKVRVQKVDSSGNILWGQTGVRATLSETNQGSNRPVSDGAGGCVVVWQYYDGINAINRINKFGQKVWGDTGIELGTGSALNIIRASDENYYVETGTIIYRISKNGEILNQYSVTLGNIVADSEGGIILSGKVWTGMIPKLVSQRKDSLGNNLWQEPYVEIADSIGLGSVNIGLNNNIINYTWLGNYNGLNSRPFVQAITIDGNHVYPREILLSEDSSGTTYMGIIASDTQSTIFSWSGVTGNSIYAQMYDLQSNKLWNPNSIIVAHPRITSQQYITDCKGGFIIGGAVNQFTIVVQQVSRDGNLGEVLPIPVEIISFTGTVNDSKVILNWITATELNNYGFEIERFKDCKIAGIDHWETIGFVEGHGTTTETHSYSFIDSEVLSGKVKYRLKQIDFDGSYEYSNVVEVSFMKPNEFSLEQNYPNPFNPTTKIKFTIPTSPQSPPSQGGEAKQGWFTVLKVYDILGNEVATLVNENKPAGTYEVEFNAEGLASGVYFYQLQAGVFLSTKKLVVLK